MGGDIKTENTKINDRRLLLPVRVFCECVQNIVPGDDGSPGMYLTMRGLNISSIFEELVQMYGREALIEYIKD